MNNAVFKFPLLALAAGLLTACGGGEAPATAETAAPAAASAEPAAIDCPAEAGLTYVCGLQGAEDLLSLGLTGRMLASGMSGENTPGHMYLVDPATLQFRELVHSDAFSQAPDTERFPSCPGPLNVQAFSVHGLSVHETAPGVFEVYTTSHGEREAIEVYELDTDFNNGGAAPTLAWKGCVVLPANTFANSVARLSDGGFVTTKMMDPAQGFAAVMSGGITGVVYEWHPGGEVTAIEGTELAGANGIAVSDDERYMYVATIGGREVVKFDRSTTPIGKQVVNIDIAPDNIRWAGAGKLLTAGNNYVDPATCSGPNCATGWSVLEVDAETLAVTRIGGADQNVALQGVSSALRVDGNIWVGSFNDDRIGFFTP